MRDKWTDMQLIADAAGDLTTEQAVKYLKYGREMESLIKLVRSQVTELLRIHPNTRALQRVCDDVIAKLESK